MNHYSIRYDSYSETIILITHVDSVFNIYTMNTINGRNENIFILVRTYKNFFQLQFEKIFLCIILCLRESKIK